MTIFEKIITRQIPAKIIWEDDDAVVFHDVNPQAPVHVLIVPKKVVPRLTDATDDDRALLGKLTSHFTDRLVPDPVTEKAGEDLYRLFT